jgi:predicted GH43/DUF377 family glycosyl hydrolase
MTGFERLGVVLRPAGEDEAKFNAGMIRAGHRAHVLYRYACKRESWRGKPIDWTRVTDEFPYSINHIRHAVLDLDGRLLSDDDAPVIFPEHPWEALGCEDPRIVPFEDAFLVFYCAFDGRKTRVGIARTSDFVRYEKLGIIDNFTYDKDAFIFPERIGGRIAYVHRILPAIQIDYFESFDAMLDPKTWKDYAARVDGSTVLRGRFDFERLKVGGGVPPIRTGEGWLLLYHGVDASRVYHIGAALLDLENPSRIRCRLPSALLSPEGDDETHGDYLGCVFPQGYFERTGELVISYGAGDKYTALAKIVLAELLEELVRHPEPAR